MKEDEVKEIIEEGFEPKVRKPSLLSRTRGYLFTGILITAPAAMTFYIAYIIIIGIDKSVVRLIPREYNPATYLPFGIPGLGVLLLFVFLITIGFFTKGFFGRYLLNLWEKLINHTPLVSGVYGALKQLFETVFSEKSNAFKQAVLVEFPRKGVWTIAFTTGRVTKEIKACVEKDGVEDLINVFVPTTPNPTSGYVIMVPRKEITPLGMKVDDALKYIISTGIVSPKE